MTAVELKMKKSDPNCGEERLTEYGGAEMVKKVDKEGSGRIVGGMDHQDGVRRAWRWNLITRKWGRCPHAPTRGSQAAREEWQVESCFPTGFPLTCRLASCTSKFEVSDRRRADRKMSLTARRVDGDGEEEIRRRPQPQRRVPEGE